MAVTINKPAGKIQVHSPQGEINKKFPDGAEKTTKIPVGPPIVEQEPMANVGVSFSLTKNLGNYESLKLTVSLFMPCTPTVEEVNETYENVKTWVDDKITELSSEVTQ